MQFLCSRQQCTIFAIKACKVNAHVPLNAKFNLLAVKSYTVEHLGIFFFNQNIYLSINLGKKKRLKEGNIQIFILIIQPCFVLYEGSKVIM